MRVEVEEMAGEGEVLAVNLTVEEVGFEING